MSNFFSDLFKPIEPRKWKCTFCDKELEKTNFCTKCQEALKRLILKERKLIK